MSDYKSKPLHSSTFLCKGFILESTENILQWVYDCGKLLKYVKYRTEKNLSASFYEEEI